MEILLTGECKSISPATEFKSESEKEGEREADTLTHI